MENYNIITLGASGAGKTVFLASLFKQLSLPTEEGIFLGVQDSEQQKQLNRIYAQVANKESWPIGTRREVTKWHFTCCVKTENLEDYPVCQFTYLDYGGGILTDSNEEEDLSDFLFDFREEIPNADAVLVLIDGQQLFKFIQGNFDLSDPGIAKWLITDLPITIQLANRIKKNPVHFVITKWDLIEGTYDLPAIRECLENKCEEFKRLVNQRVKAGCPVRLIPISSVGPEFVTMHSDGSMKKNLGKVPKPFQLEIPISYVLIDRVIAYHKNLGEDDQEIKKSVEQKFGVLLDLIPDALKQGILLTREERIQRLKNVSDAKTAFRYLIDIFVGHITDFEKKFPHANLGGEIILPDPGVPKSEDGDDGSTTFICSQKQFDNLIEKLHTWLDQQSFQHQTIKTDESSTLIQIAKKGGWRKFAGMSQALNIQLIHQKEDLKVELSGGKWIERLAPAGIIAVLEAPLLPIIGIPIAIGAWQQSKLPKEIISFISKELTQN